MKPVYAEHLIVAIKANGGFEWYVLDKEYCFLDLKKADEVAKKLGHEIPEDDSERFGIRVLNESTRELFLSKVAQCKVTTDELREMLRPETDFNEKLAYNPSLLIDFDKKILISYYAEPESFEDYVPDGWVGEYRLFEKEIPFDERFWIDKDGKNLMEENHYGK